MHGYKECRAANGCLVQFSVRDMSQPSSALSIKMSKVIRSSKSEVFATVFLVYSIWYGSVPLGVKRPTEHWLFPSQSGIQYPGYVSLRRIVSDMSQTCQHIPSVVIEASRSVGKAQLPVVQTKSSIAFSFAGDAKRPM
jgi:hypothetical protein